MVNNQEWFNEKYKGDEKEIMLRYEKFKGQLIIENYTSLENLCLSQFDSVNKITLKNLPQLQKCVVWDCKLIELVINNCPKLKNLNVRNNLLTNLKFLESLVNIKELDLNISNNNFFESELNHFSRLTNLRELHLGNSGWKKAHSDQYNRFCKSLEHLRYNNKLRELDISNTNIDKGLKYLFKDLERIICACDFVVTLSRKENKCYLIANELKDFQIKGRFQIKSDYYSLDWWRKRNNINQTNQVINNYLGNFTAQDNLLVGNQQLGDHTNLGNIRMEELTENFQTQVQIPYK